MRVLFSFLLLVFLLPLLYAQSSANQRAFDAWIVQPYRQSHPKGILHALGDSTIMFLDIHQKSNTTKIYEEIAIRDIDEIRVRRSGNIKKGMLIGAVSAFFGAVGVTAIASGGDDFFGSSPAPLYIMIGTVMAVPGAGLGALIGSKKKRIPINRNLIDYEIGKDGLEKYVRKNSLNKVN